MLHMLAKRSDDGPSKGSRVFSTFNFMSASALTGQFRKAHRGDSGSIMVRHARHQLSDKVLRYVTRVIVTPFVYLGL